MIFNGTFLSLATASSSLRTVVLPTPGMPATMIVPGVVWCSLSKEALCAGVYLVVSLLYYTLVVLLDYATRDQNSCSVSEASEEVCPRCHYSDLYSSNYC